MEIKSLSGVNVSKITQAFNEAFSDYFFPFVLKEEEMLSKIISENIILKFSAGLFDEHQLVGFIFTGIDKVDEQKIAYNAGTGIIPLYRGKNLTSKMYQYIFEILKEEKIRYHLLEVITENEKAIKVYKNEGFIINRKLNCYKGIVTKPIENTSFKIHDIHSGEIKNYNDFWDFLPSYQNSVTALSRSTTELQYLGCFIENQLAGYLVLDKITGRIKQFGVHKDCRRKKVGHHLFYKAQELIQTKAISTINIDATDIFTNNFLKHIGLQVSVCQYEMKQETK